MFCFRGWIGTGNLVAVVYLRICFGYNSPLLVFIRSLLFLVLCLRSRLLILSAVRSCFELSVGCVVAIYF